MKMEKKHKMMFNNSSQLKAWQNKNVSK